MSSLPRDVEYNAEVLRGCFTRAFGLEAKDAAAGAKPALDMARVRPGNLRERIRLGSPTIDLPLHVLKVKADHVSVR